MKILTWIIVAVVVVGGGLWFFNKSSTGTTIEPVQSSETIITQQTSTETSAPVACDYLTASEVSAVLGTPVEVSGDAGTCKFIAKDQSTITTMVMLVLLPNTGGDSAFESAAGFLKTTMKAKTTKQAIAGISGNAYVVEPIDKNAPLSKYGGIVFTKDDTLIQVLVNLNPNGVSIATKLAQTVSSKF